MNAKEVFGWLVCGGAILTSSAAPFPDAPSLVAEPRAPSSAPVASPNCRITDLIGAPVLSRDGQSVGHLADIVFDLRDGRIAFAVITTLEDERKIAVPASLLQAQTAANTLTLTCDEQHFRAASDFAKSDLSDPSWPPATEAYFRPSQPAPQFAAGSVIVDPAGAAPPPDLPTAARQNLGGASPSLTPSLIPSSLPATSFARSSDLVGSAVADNAGHPVGDIKDVVVNWSAQRILFAVLDPGGTEGLGNRYIAIAPAALSLTPAGGGFVVNVTKNDLVSAPNFNRAQWPAASDGAFVAQVTRFYDQGSH